jgi:hypothetical protein
MSTDRSSRVHRWLWFFGLWAASVLVVGVLAGIIRLALGGAS